MTHENRGRSTNGYRGADGADWTFGSNELLRIFDGFTILYCEDGVGSYDWAPEKQLRMVRLVARKPE